MRRIALIFLAGFCGLFLLAAGESDHPLHFPAHGFSIAPLEAPGGQDNGMIVSMFLPATDGFAPNVNILSQKSPGSIDEYIDISKKEFEDADFKVIKMEKVDDNTAIMQYTGKMKGSSFHWYAKASLKGDEVILITATATEDQWTQNSAQLQACVDSFKRDSDK